MKKEEQYNLIEGTDFVVLPYEQQRSILKEGIPVELMVNDLEHINNILQQAVENYNRNIKSLWEKEIDLKNYKRQYIGIINKGGEKEVFVNCFYSRHIEDAPYWKNKLVFVCDGGNNFFDVKINLAKTIYYDFQTNGYA